MTKKFLFSDPQSYVGAGSILIFSLFLSLKWYWDGDALFSGCLLIFGLVASFGYYYFRIKPPFWVEVDSQIIYIKNRSPLPSKKINISDVNELKIEFGGGRFFKIMAVLLDDSGKLIYQINFDGGVSEGFFSVPRDAVPPEIDEMCKFIDFMIGGKNV